MMKKRLVRVVMEGKGVKMNLGRSGLLCWGYIVGFSLCPGVVSARAAETSAPAESLWIEAETLNGIKGSCFPAGWA